ARAAADAARPGPEGPGQEDREQGPWSALRPAHPEQQRLPARARRRTSPEAVRRPLRRRQPVRHRRGRLTPGGRTAARRGSGVHSAGMSVTTGARVRSASVAALLSFVWPGLGEWYAGHPRRAAAFALPVLVAAVLLVVQLAQGFLETAVKLFSPSYALA